MGLFSTPQTKYIVNKCIEKTEPPQQWFQSTAKAITCPNFTNKYSLHALTTATEHHEWPIIH